MSEGRDQGFNIPRWRVMIIPHGRATVSFKILPSLFYFLFFHLRSDIVSVAYSASWIALASARSLLIFYFIYISLFLFYLYCSSKASGRSDKSFTCDKRALEACLFFGMIGVVALAVFTFLGGKGRFMASCI